MGKLTWDRFSKYRDHHWGGNSASELWHLSMGGRSEGDTSLAMSLEKNLIQKYNDTNGYLQGLARVLPLSHYFLLPFPETRIASPLFLFPSLLLGLSVSQVEDGDLLEIQLISQLQISVCHRITWSLHLDLTYPSRKSRCNFRTDSRNLATSSVTSGEESFKSL